MENWQCQKEARRTPAYHLEELNHLFQKCKTGDGFEYGAIEETMHPEAFALIGQWIEETIKK